MNDLAIALENAGLKCEIEQTGGFTMVCYVYSLEDCVAVGADSIVKYRRHDVNDGDEQNVECKSLSDFGISLKTIPDIVKAVVSHL